MDNSLPGVESYSYYTPCFLRIRSIKVSPLNDLNDICFLVKAGRKCRLCIQKYFRHGVGVSLVVGIRIPQPLSRRRV